MGGCCTALLLWLARACPKHKKMFEGKSTLTTTACKVSTSYLESKVFRDKCVRSIVIRSDDVPPMRVYGENTESTFFVIISRQLVGFSQNLVEMFFSTIPMQCPSQNSKFENFRQFIGWSEPPWWMGGGVVPHIRGHDWAWSKKGFFDFWTHRRRRLLDPPT